MFLYLLRAPTYPVLLTVGGQAFAATSGQELSTLLARLCAPGRATPELILDSRWWLFTYLADNHALAPSFMQHHAPSKLQLIGQVNGRSNKVPGSDGYPTASLGSRSRERVFRELVDILRSG